MTTHPKKKSNWCSAAWLLVTATALIIGYFYGSMKNELSDTEKQLIRSIRELESPKAIDALASAPEHLYQLILSRIPPSEDLTALRSSSPYGQLLAEVRSGHPEPDALSGIVRHIPTEKIEPSINALLLSSNSEVIELAVWLAIKLTRSNPQQAIQLATDFPSKKNRGHIIVNGVWQWAQKDPIRAYTWLSDQLSIVSSSANYVFLEMAEDNPKEASRRLRMLSSGDTIQNARRGILRSLVKAKQPDAKIIIDFIMTQPEPSRKDLVYNLFRNFIETDVIETIDSLAEALAARDWELGQHAYLAFVSDYAKDNPKTAAEWSLQIINPDYRARTLERTTETWVRNDLEGAAKWFKERPREAIYDYGRSVIAKEIAKTSPAEAIPWTESIFDASLRYRVLPVVISKWAEISPKEATAYLKETPYLSDEKRDRALKDLNQ